MGNMGYAWIYVAALGVCFWWAPAMPCRYPTLQFTTTNDSPEYFYDFIKSLRHLLESGEMPHGIRLMREPTSVPVTQRFVLVELSNIAGRQVTLAIDVVNAHVVAYRVRDEAFFFDDSSQVAYQNLFKDAVSNCTLPFDGSYGDLQNVAHQDRENMYLGRLPLDEAIGQLSLTKINGNYAPVANALMVSIQMISEAARFNYIVHRVSNHPNDEGCLPDRHMIWLENNWKYISKTVQRSTTEAGVFLIPFWFQDIQGQWRELYGVIPGLIMNMGLMIFVPSPSNFNSPPFIRTIGDVDDGETHVCPAAPEPTVGRDLRCATNATRPPVRHILSFTHLCLQESGRSVMLEACIDVKVEQEWALYPDGSIRSHGNESNCLGYDSDDVVLVPFSPANLVTRWVFDSDGCIRNLYSGFVMEATNSNRVIVKSPNGANNQRWFINL